ncbi:Rpn family recombination-promoting nuclease/putative transposase [Candidatus Amoebophilus asiaticus]|nr:Rpn family recombination-promoting nuclease/putative transposase [Candidatus Amoebophilus asiaticus]
MLYVYTLIENQSTHNKLMAFSMLSYNVALMEQHLNEGYQELPIIVNICIYTGKKSPYPYSQDICDYFEGVELAREQMFKHFKLLDLSVLSQEELLKDGTFGSVEALLRQGRERDYLNWINNNQVLIWELVSNYGLSIVIYILTTDDKNDADYLMQAIIEAVLEQKEIIVTAAQQLRQVDIQTGLIKGIKEGIEQGKEEGVKLGIQAKAQAIDKSMLKEGLEISLIQKVTGISREAIEKLTKE